MVKNKQTGVLTGGATFIFISAVDQKQYRSINGTSLTFHLFHWLIWQYFIIKYNINYKLPEN